MKPPPSTNHQTQDRSDRSHTLYTMATSTYFGPTWPAAVVNPDTTLKCWSIVRGVVLAVIRPRTSFNVVFVLHPLLSSGLEPGRKELKCAPCLLNPISDSRSSLSASRRPAPSASCPAPPPSPLPSSAFPPARRARSPAPPSPSLQRCAPA
jgi:hypothetical protein